jgi:xylulokinase
MNFIGIDVGTTGLKAIAMDQEGVILRDRAVRYPTSLAGLGAEQDARAWWNAAVRALPEVVAGEPVGGVAVTCQAPTLVAIDDEGEPLGPALTWIDRRATQEAEELAAACGPTRNPPDPYFGSAKLLWWMRNRPEQLERARAVLCANGFLVRQLCGELTLDETNAGLFQGWDGGFDPGLASAGIPVDLLPPARPSAEIAGEVSRAASEQTGLPEGTPIAYGAIDAAGAALEAGIFYEGDGLVEMTGFSTVAVTAAHRGTHVPGMIHTRHCVIGVDLVSSAMVSTGAVVEWLRRLAGIEDVREIDGRISSHRPGKLLLIPAFAGERTPTWDHEARGAVVGLDLNAGVGELALAVYEGTALGLRDNLERMEAGIGSLESVQSVGGGTKSKVWTQVKADVLGIPVEVPCFGHGAAAGAALLAGMATDTWTDVETVRSKVSKQRDRFEPHPTLVPEYTDRLAHYRRLQEVLPTVTKALHPTAREGR